MLSVAILLMPSRHSEPDACHIYVAFPLSYYAFAMTFER